MNVLTGIIIAVALTIGLFFAWLDPPFCDGEEQAFFVSTMRMAGCENNPKSQVASEQ
jgi:hypothetical protein